MSADNWTDCPRCARDAQEKAEANKRALQEVYGKLSLEGFLEIASAPTMERPIAVRHTLREDYEIGIINGVLDIGYTAHCRVCDFHFTYTNTFDVLEGE